MMICDCGKSLNKSFMYDFFKSKNVIAKFPLYRFVLKFKFTKFTMKQIRVQNFRIGHRLN